MSRLRYATQPVWTEAVLNDFDAFLQDHANCERKASAMALSLVVQCRDKPDIVKAMADLAVEELQHFQQVLGHMQTRGISLGPDVKDPYVGALRRQVRHGHTNYLMDQMLVAGVVEARGCERFGLVAKALPEDDPLKAFYEEITRSEARHGGLFVRLAKQHFDHAEVDARLDTLLDAEAELVAELPPRAALH